MDTTDLILRHIDAGLAGIHDRLDDINTRLGNVETQTTLTNGRVNGHDVELAELKTERAVEERAADSRRDSRRFRLTTAAAYLGTGIAFGGLLHTFGI